MDKNSFNTSVKKIILDYGRNIVKKDKVTHGYIEDLLVNFPAEKNISIYLAESGILKELSEKEGDLDKKDIERYAEKIVNNYGTDARITKKVVVDWIDAFNITVADDVQTNEIPKIDHEDNKRDYPDNAQVKKSFIKILISGDFGAKITFWIFAVLFDLFLILIGSYGSEILSSLSKVFTISLSEHTSLLLFNGFLLAVLGIWNLIVFIGLWSANYEQKSNNLWSFIAYTLLMVVIVFSVYGAWIYIYMALHHQR